MKFGTLDSMPRRLYVSTISYGITPPKITTSTFRKLLLKNNIKFSFHWFAKSAELIKHFVRNFTRLVLG